MISSTEEGLRLKPTFRRHQEVRIHVLRPARRVSKSRYERILDLDDIRKGDEGLCFSLGPQERRSRVIHRVPGFDGPSHGSGLPSWCQARFKLDLPSPPSAAPFSPFLPESKSSGDKWSASYFPPPPNAKVSSRCDNQKRRKSCEYCRFRKKKCSGHSTCIRCSRVGIDCVYMPDLTAKRMADCRLQTSDQSLGSCFSWLPVPTSAAGDRVGGLPRGDREYSCVTPSILRDDPPQTPLQSGKVSTQPVAPIPDQNTTPGERPNTVPAGLGPAYVESAVHSAERAFGMAARDTDFWNTGPRCVSSGVLGRYVMSVPKCWEASHPQEVYVNTPAIRPTRCTDDDARILKLEVSPPTTNPTGTEIQICRCDAPHPMETWTPLPSVAPQSSGSTAPTNIAGDATEPWTVDDWLAWHDPIFVPLRS